MTTTSRRARAIATALFCSSVLMGPSASAEPPPPPNHQTTQLAAGIGLMILGSGALGASSLFAVAREVVDNDVVDDPAGPSGGTLALIGAIGIAGAAVGLGLTIAAAGDDGPAAKRSPKPQVRAFVAPMGAALELRF